MSHTGHSHSWPAFPDGKRFAFTIFDDTDCATVERTKPFYDLLHELGLRTTKSVWVLPSRGNFSGQSLRDHEYRDFILDLEVNGFEIALHNVGDGTFTRNEILSALDEFEAIIGHGPRLHTNHVSNPDNIYWYADRFEWPFNLAYRLAYRLKHGGWPSSGGSAPETPHFWGDECKRRIMYMRNLTFNKVNTLASDPRMPYLVTRKQPYSNYWFSSSDAQDAVAFKRLLSADGCDELERSGGACIVYTHTAAGFVTGGKVDSEVESCLRDLARRNGWFVPVGTLLDHLRSHNGGADPGYLYRIALNFRWVYDRVVKRFTVGR